MSERKKALIGLLQFAAVFSALIGLAIGLFTVAGIAIGQLL